MPNSELSPLMQSVQRDMAHAAEGAVRTIPLALEKYKLPPQMAADCRAAIDRDKPPERRGASHQIWHNAEWVDTLVFQWMQQHEKDPKYRDEKLAVARAGLDASVPVLLSQYGLGPEYISQLRAFLEEEYQEEGMVQAWRSLYSSTYVSHAANRWYREFLVRAEISDTLG